MRRALPLTIAAVLVAGATGCSLLLDWNDFSGGSDASTSDAHGGDGAPESPPDDDAPYECTGAMACVPSAPSGWVGPIAFYTGPTAQGAAPACGAGFAATPAFDGNAGPDAGPASCSACGCGPVTGESCADPVMTVYAETNCTFVVPGPFPITTTCTPSLPGQSVTVAAPLPTGGACTATGSVATTPPVAWSSVARACSPATAPTANGCSAGDVCAPSPESPFSICVMQSAVATSCPAGYPDGPQVFYASVDDQRACSACQCAAASGGSCTLAANAISICGTSTTLNAPNACTAFDGPDPVALVAAPVLASAGSCAVSGGGVPGGTVTPSGPTSFCCSP